MFLDIEIIGIIQKNTPRGLSITPSSANFLIIVNRRRWQVVMYDITHIGLIYSHTKRIRRADYLIVIAHKILFNLAPYIFFSVCMILFCIQAQFLEKSRYHIRISLRRSINDTCSGLMLENFSK